MPDFPIIDAHVHLWDPTRFRMSWLDGNTTLGRPYGLPEYRQQTEGIEVEAMVYLEVDVEPPYKLLEATWAVEQAKKDPRLQCIVASAPVEYGELARTYLRTLIAIDSRIKGVRRLLQGEPDPEFCLHPGFIRGAQILAEYGLSFDICIYHYQLPGVLKLVRQCPDTAFILDHIGKPDIKGHALDPWREHIQALASYPNVVCKVSGMVTEADQQNWSPDDLAPYVEHVLDAFGEDRVIFGGDWPVILLASSYKRWVETLDALTAQLSPQAKRKLWAENARRFYRLKQEG
ncbi:MAG TPA: amidohydrolase family protein [Ktedonobacteraceae bacterium]|nr:amidohydrolase family protein [Ktedonobacteraceae bacterium]